MKRITVKKGQILQETGELYSKVYTVRSGLLRSYAIDENGKEHIFMFAPQGWIITDNVSPNVPSALFIDALEDSEVMVTNKRGEEEQHDTSKMIKRLMVLQKRIILLMSASAIERYDHFVRDYPDLVQRVSQRMIASYLGITPEALSKVKGDRKRKKTKSLRNIEKRKTKKEFMKNEKKNVLVAGANGTTGRIIIEILQKSDTYKPVAMVRKQEQKERFENQNVTTVLADLEEDLSQAVTQIDKVIFAAGSGGKKVVEVDQEGAKRLTDAAKQAGIKKFVMLSSMGADDPSQGGELEDYLKAKHNADEYLRASNLDYVIVRPGSLTNEDGQGKIKLDSKLDKGGDISRADVAKTLVAVLDDSIMLNQTFEILKGEIPIEKAVMSN